jgi:hypothetical protein
MIPERPKIAGKDEFGVGVATGRTVGTATGAGSGVGTAFVGDVGSVVGCRVPVK